MSINRILKKPVGEIDEVDEFDKFNNDEYYPIRSELLDHIAIEPNSDRSINIEDIFNISSIDYFPDVLIFDNTLTLSRNHILSWSGTHWVNSNDASLRNITSSNMITAPEGGLTIGSTVVSATAAELNYLDITTLGTSEASKAVTANASGDITVADNLTVAGGLTVDTSTLKVDSSNNRVGIGTASPSKTLHVVDTTSTEIARFQGSDGNIGITAGSKITFSRSGDNYLTCSDAAGVLNFETGGNNRLSIDSTGTVTVANSLILSGGSGISLSPASAHPAFVVGNILSFESGASGGLELSDCNDSSNYLNAPIGVSLETSAENNTSAIKVHTIHGGKVNIKLSSSTTNQGQWVYLSTTAGTATTTVPTSGLVWRLGVSTERNTSAVTDVDIIWMPQFIADLG